MTHFIQEKFGQCLQISDRNLNNTDSLVKEICTRLSSILTSCSICINRVSYLGILDHLTADYSLIKIIPQTQFSYRRGLTGMAYRSSSRDLINLHIETKY